MRRVAELGSLGRMSTLIKVRCWASLGLLGSLGVIGHFGVVWAICHTYFPNDSNAGLAAIVFGCCLVAAYFIACIRSGRFIWIMPRQSKKKDETNAA